MFSTIHKYIYLGLGFVILTLSVAGWFFYTQNNANLERLAVLRVQVTQLENVVKDKNTQISIMENIKKLQEETLQNNREEIRKRNEELSQFEREIKSPGLDSQVDDSIKQFIDLLNRGNRR
jgi:Tfp pilus assembly protein PilO